MLGGGTAQLANIPWAAGRHVRGYAVRVGGRTCAGNECVRQLRMHAPGVVGCEGLHAMRQGTFRRDWLE